MSVSLVGETGAPRGNHRTTASNRQKRRWVTYLVSWRPPASVDPVNATLLTSGWSTMAPPAVGPYPGNMFTTPAGIPTCEQQLETIHKSSVIYNFSKEQISKTKGPISHP